MKLQSLITNFLRPFPQQIAIIVDSYMRRNQPQKQNGFSILSTDCSFHRTEQCNAAKTCVLSNLSHDKNLILFPLEKHSLVLVCSLYCFHHLHIQATAESKLCYAHAYGAV